MDERQALQILLEDSLLFPPHMKKEIMDKIPTMSEIEMQDIGRVLALEHQKRLTLRDTQKEQLEESIQTLQNLIQSGK